VVTNPRVPRLIRHSLNLESGLNDGLALPAVLAFTAALEADRHFVWWRFVLEDVSLGFVTGGVVGFVAARLLPRGRALGADVTPHQKALYALGVAFAAYGAAVLQPQANGFISVFVCAIVLGILRPDVRECFEVRSEDVIELVKLGIFVVFGAVLTTDILFADGWAAVAIAVFTLVLARPIAVFVALAGTRQVGVDGKAFMSWFGPKGVATMTYALFVLSSDVTEAGRIFGIAALAVMISVVVHGITDQPGAEWIGRRAEARSAA
jgi:sodium/hydrogen antiporter